MRLAPDELLAVELAAARLGYGGPLTRCARFMRSTVLERVEQLRAEREAQRSASTTSSTTDEITNEPTSTTTRARASSK